MRHGISFFLLKILISLVVIAKPDKCIQEHRNLFEAFNRDLFEPMFTECVSLFNAKIACSIATDKYSCITEKVRNKPFIEVIQNVELNFASKVAKIAEKKYCSDEKLGCIKMIVGELFDDQISGKTYNELQKLIDNMKDNYFTTIIRMYKLKLLQEEKIKYEIERVYANVNNYCRMSQFTI